MGSIGFIVLGLAALGAATAVIMKVIGIQERSEERAHSDKMRECKRDEQ